MSDEIQASPADEQTLDDVLAQYIASEEAGSVVDRQRLLRQHPQLADELREFFANRDQMLRLAQPLRGIGNANRASQPLGKLRYFGDYELLEEIAVGGMGIVYRARQVSLNRIVAVKMILKGTLASEEDVKRFRAEAEAAASLQHPAIVAIHEVGLHEGQHYFSMDYVEGQNLAELPRQQPLSARQAAEYVRDAAEAVHYAHQQGTLHRDLKPSNILIDRHGRVRITDFGLAKRIEGNSDLTLTGQILGTPSYMPPEQASGKRSLIGAASDIYSLGAVLYDLLTGRPPFRGESPAETLRQVESLDPLSPRLLNPATPRELETICLKCLEKEPHKRYGTAQLLAEDLGRYMRGEPILARPISRAARGCRWCRCNPAVAGLMTTVAACLIVGTAVSSYFAVAESFQRQRADGKAAEALREKSAAETARALAEQRKSEAEVSAATAERRRDEAEKSSKLARHHLYVAHMNLAQLAWENGWADQTTHLLNRYRLPQRQTEAAEDFRGFEWFYWDRSVHGALLTLQGHPGQVKSVTFSPDGKQLASAEFSGVVKFWDSASGQEVRSLRVDRPKVEGNTITQLGVYCVEFSPNWKRMASAQGDRTITLWDATTGAELLKLSKLEALPRFLAFSPDGTRLASVSNNQLLQVWDLSTGLELLRLKGDKADLVRSVAFSPDGSRLASAWNLTVKVWDAGTGKELLALQGHTKAISSLAFNSDGTRLASASFDQTVKTWDCDTGKELLTLSGHTKAVECVSFSPDGKRLVSAGQDHMLKVWDASTGQESFTLRGHSGTINQVAFSPDGKCVASASDDHSVKVWDPETSLEPLTLRGHASGVRRAVFSPDGLRLASASFDKTVKVWDALSGRVSQTLQHADLVRWVAFSPDGQRLASASERGSIKLWDATTGQDVRTLEENAGTCVEFSPDGRHLASASGAMVKLWNAATGEKVHSFQSGKFGLACLAYSPDGKILASAGFDRAIRGWDTATHREVFTLTGTASLACLALSPDGRSLASANQDGTIALWDLGTQQESFGLKAHSTSAASVAFSPAGNRLASGGSDGATELWDVSTGQQLLSLKAANGVTSVAFSPDGLRLAAASSDTIKIWDAIGSPPGAQAVPLQRAAQYQPPAPLLAHFRFNGDSRDEANANAVLELKNTEFRENALYLSDKYELNKARDGYRAVFRTPALNYNQFTVALRFKAQAFAHPQSNLITGGTSTRWFCLKSSPAGNLTISLNNNEFTRELKDVALPKDKWTVVACGVDILHSRVAVYLDGNQAADIDLPRGFKLRVMEEPRFRNGDKVWSFANYANATIFHGLMDELIIYGSMLSPEEFEKVPLRP